MFDDSSEGGGGDWLPASPLLGDLAAATTCTHRALTHAGISDSLADARQACLAAAALINAAEAARLHAIRIMDAHEGEATGVFYPGTVAQHWLADHANLTSGRARALVNLARTGDPEADAATGNSGKGALPMMAAALTEGLVTREHLEIGVRALTQLPTGMMREHADAIDALLTEHAKTLPPSDASQMATALVETLAPKDLEDYPDTAHERRSLRVRTDRTGMVRVEGQLDPVGGALFKTLIEHLASVARTHAAQTEGGEGLETEDGEGVGLPATLTPDQYLADAAVELTRYAQVGLGTEHPHAEPTRVTVVVTPEQMTHPHAEGAQAEPEAEAPEADAGADDCEPTPTPAWCRNPGPATCEATGVLSTQTLQTLLCDAVMDRVVINRDGKVVSLTTLGRLANRAQRRALAARDGGCTWPGCHAKATWSDAHHIVWWSRGGTTVLDNLCLLCQHHHSEIHREQWEIVTLDGVPWFRPPPWIDPHQHLRRNTRHRTLAQTITAAHRLAAGQPVGDLLRDTGPWETQGDLDTREGSDTRAA